jgi:hypothetical protein
LKGSCVFDKPDNDVDALPKQTRRSHGRKRSIEA